ncbi:uncharacterized protein LOC108949972 [Ciona intestinalis]
MTIMHDAASPTDHWRYIVREITDGLRGAREENEESKWRDHKKKESKKEEDANARESRSKSMRDVGITYEEDQTDFTKYSGGFIPIEYREREQRPDTSGWRNGHTGTLSSIHGLKHKHGPGTSPQWKRSASVSCVFSPGVHNVNNRMLPLGRGQCCPMERENYVQNYNDGSSDDSTEFVLVNEASTSFKRVNTVRETSFSARRGCPETTLEYINHNKATYPNHIHRAPISGTSSSAFYKFPKMNSLPPSVRSNPARTHAWRAAVREQCRGSDRLARSLPHDIVKIGGFSQSMTSSPAITLCSSGMQPCDVTNSYKLSKAIAKSPVSRVRSRKSALRKTRRRQRTGSSVKTRHCRKRARLRRNSNLYTKKVYYKSTNRSIYAEPASDNFFLALFASLFCCLPLGLASLCYTYKVKKHLANKDHDKAHMSSLLGRSLANTGVMLGITGLAITLVFFIVRANMPYASMEYDYYLPEYMSGG